MSSSQRYAGDDVWNEVASLRRELAKANGVIRDYQKQLEGAEERLAIQSAWIEYLQAKQRKQKDAPPPSTSFPECVGAFGNFDDVIEPIAIKKDDAAIFPEDAAFAPLSDRPTPAEESEPQRDSPTSSVGKRILLRSNEHYYCFGLPQDHSTSKDHGLLTTKPSDSIFCFPRRRKSRYSGEDNDTSLYAEESSVSSWEGNHQHGDRKELLPCRVKQSSTETTDRTQRRTKGAESLRLLFCIAPGSEQTS